MPREASRLARSCWSHFPRAPCGMSGRVAQARRDQHAAADRNLPLGSHEAGRRASLTSSWLRAASLRRGRTGRQALRWRCRRAEPRGRSRLRGGCRRQCRGQGSAPAESLRALLFEVGPSKWINSIQFTRPRASTKPADELADDVAKRFLKARVSRTRARDRRWVRAHGYRSVIAALEAAGIDQPEELVRKQQPIKGRIESHVFDLVAGNGKTVTAALALSFEGQTPAALQREYSSAAWTLEDVRSEEADLPLAVSCLRQRAASPRSTTKPSTYSMRSKRAQSSMMTCPSGPMKWPRRSRRLWPTRHHRRAPIARHCTPGSGGLQRSSAEGCDDTSVISFIPQPSRFGLTERRRSRTYPAWGYQTRPVLKPWLIWLNHRIDATCGPVRGPARAYLRPNSALGAGPAERS
jgi:hypothetical protein